MKEKLLKNREAPRSFKVGENVVFVDYEGLPKEVEEWLMKRDVHVVKRVFSSKTEPVLILEEIDGTYPKLGDKPYPFMSDRVIKSK